MSTKCSWFSAYQISCWRGGLNGTLLAALPTFLKSGHVGIHHWSEIKRDQLRENQTAGDGKSKGTAGLASGSIAERHGQRTQQRCHGGHHDGAETREAAFI